MPQQLNVNVPEVEELLVGLILEGKVDGRIDQVGMRLELDRKYVPSFHIIFPHGDGLLRFIAVFHATNHMHEGLPLILAQFILLRTIAGPRSLIFPVGNRWRRSGTRHWNNGPRPWNGCMEPL